MGLFQYVRGGSFLAPFQSMLTSPFTVNTGATSSFFFNEYVFTL